MKERKIQPKKTTADSFSIPALRQSIPGFGSESSGASSQPAVDKPLAHDISRVPLRSPQAKLTINQPPDIYEQQADTVAHESADVMQHNERAVQRSQDIKSMQLQQPTVIQRMTGDDEYNEPETTTETAFESKGASATAIENLEQDNVPNNQPQTSQEFLSEVLGVPIDENRNPNNMIPQEIHRFWSGGKMSQEALQVLMDSAEKTKNTTWQNNMWYSSTLEEKMESLELVNKDEVDIRNLQREILKASGYNVRQIEEVAEDEPQPLGFFDKLKGTKEPTRTRGRIAKGDLETMAQKATTKLQVGGQDRWDGVKHISDIARLMYLEQVGGHHFDVDMGLGEMDLNRSYYHNDPEGNIPLMGAVTAIGNDPIAESLTRLQGRNDNGGFSNPETRDAGTKVAEQARDMSGMLNGMIASRPGNENIKEAIEVLRPDAVSKNGEIPSGMIANKELLFGSQGKQGRSQEEQRQINSLAVPPYLFDLEHLTSESENR